MNVLIINSGSSSIKYQLIKMPSETVSCEGMVERIGLDQPTIHYKTASVKLSEVIIAPTHKEGLAAIASLLMDDEKGVIVSADEVHVVGHRVVHGGSNFTATTLIDDKVKQKIKKLTALAPLHNPANLQGILVAEEAFTKARQVAVFDTAFHQTIPETAYTYAIPKKISEENNIRLYGFHGTSHKYVSEKAIAFLGAQKSKLITIHLGNGCSISAIKDGESIDHSLGFGPMNGLVMGTRSGDVDQSVIFYLMNKFKWSAEEMSNLLQKQSGMLGLTGYSDLRDVESAAEKGDKDCLLALAINAYRIKKYIGSYIAALNGIDALVFTAGIGENSDTIRKLVCEDLEYFGISLDDNLNKERSKEIREISTSSSKVKVLVIPTNEEIEIAKQSYQLVSEL